MIRIVCTLRGGESRARLTVYVPRYTLRGGGAPCRCRQGQNLVKRASRRAHASLSRFFDAAPRRELDDESRPAGLAMLDPRATAIPLRQIPDYGEADSGAEGTLPFSR